jgi:hypothetical protein
VGLFFSISRIAKSFRKDTVVFLGEVSMWTLKVAWGSSVKSAKPVSGSLGTPRGSALGNGLEKMENEFEKYLLFLGWDTSDPPRRFLMETWVPASKRSASRKIVRRGSDYFVVIREDILLHPKSHKSDLSDISDKEVGLEIGYLDSSFPLGTGSPHPMVIDEISVREDARVSLEEANPDAEN